MRLLSLTLFCVISVTRAIPVPWFIFPHHTYDDFGAPFHESSQIGSALQSDGRHGYSHAEWEQDYPPTENDFWQSDRRNGFAEGDVYDNHSMLLESAVSHPAHHATVFDNSYASHGFDPTTDFWTSMYDEHHAGKDVNQHSTSSSHDAPLKPRSESTTTTTTSVDDKQAKLNAQKIALSSSLIGSAPNPLLVQALLDAQAKAAAKQHPDGV